MDKNTCLVIAGSVLIISGIVGCALKIDMCGWLILFGVFAFFDIN